MTHRIYSKAFTLLELIVVVVVLGILAALAIPSFSTVKQSSIEKTTIASAQGVVRDARALAAFDGAALSEGYIDTAGAELGASYSAITNTVTLVSGGNSATALINTTTGAVTITTTNSVSIGGGGSQNQLIFNQGTDYDVNAAVYLGAAGSAGGTITGFDQSTMSTALYNKFAALAGTESMTVTIYGRGGGGVTYSATLSLSGGSFQITVDPTFSYAILNQELPAFSSTPVTVYADTTQLILTL